MLAALFDLRFFFVSELPAIVSVALVVVLTELVGAVVSPQARRVSFEAG